MLFTVQSSSSPPAAIGLLFRSVNLYIIDRQVERQSRLMADPGSTLSVADCRVLLLDPEKKNKQLGAVADIQDTQTDM
jgi:hypothetical protein